MSGNISSNVTAGYTEVDLSKKKNRMPGKSQDQIRSNEVAMYDVLQREIPLAEALSVNQPKSSHGSFKSSASTFVKVGLAVTVFLVFMAIVAFTVLIIILFIKVSALEAAESNTSILLKNKLQKYFDSLEVINSTLVSLQQEHTNNTEASIVISIQNISLLENILYRKITSLNSSVQTVANNF